MREATGEVSMTVIVIVAVAVIGAILASQWGNITNMVKGALGGNASNYCPAGQTWDTNTKKCK